MQHVTCIDGRKIDNRWPEGVIGGTTSYAGAGGREGKGKGKGREGEGRARPGEGDGQRSAGRRPLWALVTHHNLTTVRSTP